MNIKRFILASIAVFVVFENIDTAMHMFVLSGFYQNLEHLWRKEMWNYMWIMYLSVFFFSFMFVYVFTKGCENRGVLEGLRYGLIIGLLMNVVGIFSQFVVYPIPIFLAVIWFAYAMVQYIICGIVTALIYKPKK